ncbi:MAG: GAF domain-containing protein, partial [Bacteroidia bacterium]|nr:GAF domain-containing protein [Bacteroidia bacterium]
MDINDLYESPLYLKVSFNKLIEQYENLADSKDAFTASRAKRVLKAQEPYPELRTGFTDTSKLDEYQDAISIILEDLFTDILTLNEVKTASIPFHNLIFNSSQRFKNIIKAAGDDFELKIKNMPEDDVYIMACTIIMKFCYGLDLSFKRPFYYDIPDANGILRHYKIMYNADFIEIEPTDKAKEITQADVDELLDNYENIDLWKEKFPPGSYVFKGFVINNIFDVTDDQAISTIKSNLITENRGKDENFTDDFQEVFRSLLNIKDLEVGFSVYNKEDKMFERVYGEPIVSYLLNKKDSAKCDKTLCRWSLKTLIKDKKFYAVSDVDKFYELSKGKAPQYRALKEQGFKSAILAPLANEEGLMGILELVSKQPKVLNSVNANRLIDVMPFIVSAVERSKNEEKNM